MRKVVQVGQFWSVCGYLYDVTSLDSGDACYPIVLSEVARSGAVRREIATIIGGMPEHLRGQCSLTKPNRMTQEQAWFDRRADVVRWNGTVAKWLEAHS